MKRIEIVVTPDGQTSVETKGFAGPECREASKFLEDALGCRTDERLTPSFHETSTRHSIRQQNR